MTDTWNAVLDQFERKISSGRASLTTGEPFEPFVLEPFVPPADIGQLPQDLVDRAVSLLEQNNQLEHDLRDAMSVVQGQLAESNKHSNGRSNPFAQSAAPQHFDGAV